MKSRRQLAIFLIIILLIIAFSLQDFVPFGSKSAHELNTARTVPDVTRQDAGRVIVPNGSDNLNQSSSLIEGPDRKGHSHGKRAPETLSYDQAVCKGVRNLRAIQQGNPNPPRFTQHDFDDGGWTLVSDFPRVIPDELKTPVEKLGIPSNPDGMHRIAAQQYSDFTTMNGQRSDVSHQPLKVHPCRGVSSHKLLKIPWALQPWYQVWQDGCGYQFSHSMHLWLIYSA